jgi:hypothetical protein
MPMTEEEIRSAQRDYFVASWEENELVMEPHCLCGNDLEEDYYCKKCNRKCDITFIACKDPQALSVVEKLLQGNPSFKKFEATLLDN